MYGRYLWSTWKPCNLTVFSLFLSLALISEENLGQPLEAFSPGPSTDYVNPGTSRCSEVPPGLVADITLLTTGWRLDGSLIITFCPSSFGLESFLAAALRPVPLLVCLRMEIRYACFDDMLASTVFIHWELCGPLFSSEDPRSSAQPIHTTFMGAPCTPLPQPSTFIIATHLWSIVKVRGPCDWHKASCWATAVKSKQHSYKTPLGLIETSANCQGHNGLPHQNPFYSIFCSPGFKSFIISSHCASQYTRCWCLQEVPNKEPTSSLLRFWTNWEIKPKNDK